MASVLDAGLPLPDELNSLAVNDSDDTNKLYGVALTGVEHEVKSWTHLYDEHIAGRKTADMRDKRDRNYRVGDILHMRRYDFQKGIYTGESCRSLITHIISNDTPCAMSSAILDRNFCILSLKLLEHSSRE